MKVIKVISGILISLVFIWIIFHNSDWPVTYRAILNADIKYILLSQAFAWGGFFIRIKRWDYIVRASHKASFKAMFSSTQIGFLINFIIPARVGEIARAYLFSRFTHVPLSRSVTLVGLDRMTDLFGLIVVSIVVLASFPENKEFYFAKGTLYNAEDFVISTSFIKPALAILTSAVAGFFVILTAILMKRETILHLSKAWGEKTSHKLGKRIYPIVSNILQGMHILNSKTDLIKALLFSLITWGTMVLSIAALLWAFHIETPWAGPFFIVMMIALFISIPVTPGVIGQYHISIIAGLLIILPDMNMDLAISFALSAHLLNMLPIIVLGVICLFQERINLFSLIKTTSHGPIQ